MKIFILILGLAIFIFACSTQKGVVKLQSNETEDTAQDSVEYGMETFDSKFKSWYSMQNIEANYHSQQYYESWNNQYISGWNSKVATSQNNFFFESIIDFNPNVDYGFKLNHELFYYFQYVENILKVKIIPNGPKVILH